MLIFAKVLSLAATIGLFALADFVYLKNRKSLVNRTFFLYMLSGAVWSLGISGVIIAATASTALAWVRVLNAGLVFIPACFLHFVFTFLNLKEKRKYLPLIYAISFIFFTLSFSHFFTRSVTKLPYGFVASPGTLFPLFLAVLIGMFSYGHYELYKVYKDALGIRRNQIKYFFLGTIIVVLGGLSVLPSIFGFPVLKGFPLWSFTNILYGSILTYAIVTYHLMDISLAIRDTTLRLVSSLIPAVVFIIVSMIFFSRPSTIIAITLAAITSPLFYRPFRRLLRPVILGGKYEYQQKLRRISDKWFSIFSLDRLSESLVKDVANTIGTKYCNFMIYDEDGKSYFVKSNTGLKEGEREEEILFEEVGPLVSYLKKKKTIAIKEVLKIQPPFSEHDPVVKEMNKVKATISVPLYIDNELKGILNLGDKVSGEMYNRQDLDILSQIARDAEVMFRYSFFNYEQSLLVYRYSHDLRTPLDPVQTYLYLMAQGKLNEEEKEKYLKIVRKNIDFVAQGLSDMYQLSQMAYDRIRKKFVFSHFDIIEMVKRIVEDFTPGAKKKEIYLRFNRAKQMPLAYGHEQSIERLIRNLIQNGIKFTDKGGVEIGISSEREDVRIKVSDTGPGIPKKDLPRIFNPFFKTKGRDQIIEGSGLGLTIVKEIAALHGGEINVESEVGKGTTFTILLPALKRRKIGVKSSR